MKTLCVECLGLSLTMLTLSSSSIGRCSSYRLRDVEVAQNGAGGNDVAHLAEAPSSSGLSVNSRLIVTASDLRRPK